MLVLDIQGGRLMGLDVGRKTIGIAVSDPLGVTAQGVEVWRRRTLETDLAHLERLADHYGVTSFVVGLPRRTDGSEGPEAQSVREFAAALERSLARPVILWDERFTTAEAQKALIGAGVRRDRRKGVVDMTAAALILDGYLARRRSWAPPGR